MAKLKAPGLSYTNAQNGTAILLGHRSTDDAELPLLRITADVPHNLMRFMPVDDTGGFQWTDLEQAVEWMSLNYANGLSLATSGASHLRLSGSATSVVQILMGAASAAGSIGTMYSSAAAYLATNAQQTTRGADAWQQSQPTVASIMATVNVLSGLGLYSAPAGKAAGTLAAFWGSPVFSVNTAGDIVARALTVGASISMPNTIYLLGKTSGGTSHRLIGLDATNVIQLGVDGETVRVGAGGLSVSAQTTISTPSDGNVLVAQRVGGTNNPGLFVRVTEATGLVDLIADGSTSAHVMRIVLGSSEAARFASGVLCIGTTVTSGAVGGIVLANGVPLYGVNAAGTGAIALVALDSSNRLYFNAQAAAIRIDNAKTATTATAGAASGLPSAPGGYLYVNIAGTDYKVPFYPV